MTIAVSVNMTRTVTRNGLFLPSPFQRHTDLLHWVSSAPSFPSKLLPALHPASVPSPPPGVPQGGSHPPDPPPSSAPRLPGGLHTHPGGAHDPALALLWKMPPHPMAFSCFSAFFTIKCFWPLCPPPALKFSFLLASERETEETAEAMEPPEIWAQTLTTPFTSSDSGPVTPCL